MKKLLTLIALMACFLGAKAANWEQVYSIDYSSYNGFPFYVMGYVPEFDNGCMTDYGAYYGYKTDVEMEDFSSGAEVGAVTTQGGAVYHKVELDEPAWHQYFIADGIPTELDGHYKVVALVKASEAVSFNVNMGWGWGNGEQVGGSVGIPQSDDFVEVEWEYEGIGGTSCNLIAQAGSNTATIEWQSLVVYHEVKATQSPVEWIEAITFNGDAESAWPNWALEETDGINANWRGDRTGEICAWALTMGRNFDDQNTLIPEDSPRARPFPADIEVDPADANNHVFAVHVDQIAPIDAPYYDENSVQWSNQFWIQSPRGWKSGDQVRIKFRYKAEHDCAVGTQWHRKIPSDYNDWNACGDIYFTTDWQEFEATKSPADGTWSLAFSLCSDAENGRTPNVFYFDDLSWETMVLEEGLFVASSNTATGLEYDFDNAVPFEWDAELEAYVATAGTVGDQDSWVNELMISTVAGNDAAFKGNTISPYGSYIGEDEWGEYTAKTLSKIKLPAAGVWQIAVDTDSKQINIVKLEGEADKQPVDIVTNMTAVKVVGQERDWLTADGSGNPREAEVGTGQTWDNQLFIIANRTLAAGEVTVLKFKYKASKEAKATTQCHVLPGQYKHWGAIGDVNFTTDWQDFSQTFTVPTDADGMQSFAFNMAEIKDACNYEITDVQWYLACDEEGKTMENLIDAEGTKNFYVKEGAGTDPYQFGTGSQVIVEPTDKLSLSIPKTLTSGQEFLVSIALDNERTDYCAFKMDLQVSDGISFVREMNEDEELAYVVALNADRKKSDHQLSWNLINNNTLRITCFSSTNKTFKGNSGEIVTVKLKVEGWAKSSANVCLRDAYLTTTGEQDVYMSDYCQEFSVTPADQLTLSLPKTLSTGQEFVASIALDNERTDYCAFKMDLQVSDGISFVQEMNEDEELAYVVALNADRKKSDHQLSWNLINNNTLRITCFSSTNKTFKGNSGEFVTVKLKAEDWAEGRANVCLRDAYLTTTGEQDVYMSDYCQEFSVTSAEQTQWLKEELQNAINDVENEILGMAYQNVAGMDSLNTLLNTGRQMLNQDVLIEDDVWNLMDVMWQQFDVVRNLSNSYANLASRLNSLVSLMSIVDVSEAQAVEINAFVETVSQGLAAGSYDSRQIAQLNNQMTSYMEMIGNVNLTINLEQENTLSEKLSAFSSDYSIIKGLTITGALGISDLSFVRSYLSGLTRLDMLGTNLTIINNKALSGMTQLEEVVLPQELTNLESYAFQNCYALKRVVLPATLTYIYRSFRGCSSLREIVCNATVPPSTSNYIIDGNTEYNCTLTVPIFYVENYRNTSYWNMFNIVGSMAASEDLTLSTDFELYTNEEMYKELKTINVAMRDLGNNYGGPERYNFGALVVEGDSMLSVNDYKMAYAPYVQYMTKNYDYDGRRASSVLINNAPMRADNVSVNLTLQANIWQFISLPFDIKVSDIKWDSNDQLYAIYKYDGKKRADQDMQNTWVRMTADSTLQAGVGYIWQVPSRYDEVTGYYYDNVGCELKARNNGNKNKIFLNSDAEVKMAEYLSEFVQDRSWNLLGNPYPAYFASRAMDITSPFTVWNMMQQNYEAYSPVDDDYVFAPGEAFFFQRPLDQANITFLKDGRQTDGYSYGRVFFSGARQSDMTAKRSLFNLFLSDDEQMDRTRFVINEEASLGYEMDKDASKFASMNANAVQLYTIENGVHYAINERPLGKGEIALGMSTPKKGSYTLKLDTKVDNEVILVDRLTGVEVLLNEQDYTFTAEAGKMESRFMVRLGMGETTGISSTSARSEGEAVIYDLSGRRIDNSQKPAANGLYIINGKKVVVK